MTNRAPGAILMFGIFYLFCAALRSSGSVCRTNRESCYRGLSGSVVIAGAGLASVLLEIFGLSRIGAPTETEKQIIPR